MSQHLITQFINRSYQFKPFNDAKIENHKLKKYDSSNRQNNSSPEDIAESTHALQKIRVKSKEEAVPDTESKIDITV
ncbi:hypothetical protein CW745_01845 [Psychromonas sp. psych-6C06]|uniref:hypothetical protein n=1 Tax=Psychromonas sp. psych-6C06 TaxID=2058089 RepID=UPI000C33278F|nr:hypothetical protein [Psychromonas sp. psych-6C06]PKF63613.1 hypothetical protein CW745_01845 [Psychromonas sp. psych-6C06]